jgi:hypothetical protein
MRNWKSEVIEAKIIKGLKKQFNTYKNDLYYLEDKFIEILFNEKIEDSYSKIYEAFKNAYSKVVNLIKEKFGHLLDESDIQTFDFYFENNYKPLENAY